MKKALAALLCGAMVVSFGLAGCGTSSSEEAAPADEAGTEVAEATGDASADASGEAVMTTVDLVSAGMNTVDSEDGTFYVYAPADPHDFDIMSGLLNGIIYLYPDTPVSSQDEAESLIDELGLKDIAEVTPAYIVVPEAADGQTYSEADLNLYHTSQYLLSGGEIVMTTTGPTAQYTRCTYNNLQYVMAEGQGATFVNNVLTQNADRIACVLTFGGEMEEGLAEGYALPAYLVNATDTAIDYYKSVNGTDVEDGNHFYQDGYTEKQVVVAEGSDTFDKDIVQEAWSSTMSKLTKACLSGNVVLDNTIYGDWILETWPNYQELGITVKSYDLEGYESHDFVPENLEDGAPLVIVLHGMSDDPYYTVNSCGWADKAAEEGLLVIAPDYPTFGLVDDGPPAEATDFVEAVIDYAVENYNIDTSRVYLTGFSMGGATTGFVALEDPELFAAVVTMGATGLPNAEAAATDDVDLPWATFVGTIDSNNISEDDNGNPMMLGIRSNTDGFDAMFALNEVTIDSYDYAEYPYWGFATDSTEVVTYKNLKYTVQKMAKEGYDTDAFMEFVYLDDAAHACSDYYATLAWDFMSQYSRGEDGSVVVNK